MSNHTFIPTPKFKKSFKRLFKKYRSLKDDFEQFRNEFLQNPLIGDDLGGGFRKIRMAIQSKQKGKSAGARIIVYTFYVELELYTILLVDIYDKSELSTMQDFEYQRIVNEFFA
ncbi:MAG: addiction module toxin RelE [Bacteroidales bacterium]|jgi:hypothetical protein|nr:addiction module toxin RelE [Bacteroidales bacterium]